MRLFIAIQLNPEIRRELSHLKERIKGIEGIRWVKSENIHLTLIFLGEVEEDRVEAIKRAMREGIKGFLPFSIRPKGLGVFPHPRNVRVIWVGIEPKEKVVVLQQRLEKELRKAGFSFEKRRFEPHLTLGRAKRLQNREDFFKIMKEINKIDLSSSLKVEEIELIQSRLTPQGPIYQTLTRERLGK